MNDVSDENKGGIMSYLKGGLLYLENCKKLPIDVTVLINDKLLNLFLRHVTTSLFI